MKSMLEGQREMRGGEKMPPSGDFEIIVESPVEETEPEKRIREEDSRNKEGARIIAQTQKDQSFSVWELKNNSIEDDNTISPEMKQVLKAANDKEYRDQEQAIEARLQIALTTLEARYRDALRGLKQD